MPDDQLLQDVPVLTPRTLLVGEQRDTFRAAAARAYSEGEHSVAAIARHSRRSSQFVRNVLIEAEVAFRPLPWQLTRQQPPFVTQQRDDRPPSANDRTVDNWPPPGKRLRPEQQESVTSEFRRKYDAGASIQALAEESGWSYGYVHRRLAETGPLRSPGGNVRSRRRQRGSGPQPPR
ncbi:helix-turn-helix domain-containing protein [Streptomyces sp. NPDC093707]|uniref:helix-turn-helix domain-containing protein n=1 Tax=Streptomyces sp. NPDC093707 TaxID=3154984 RepID=UPI00344B569E